METEMTDIKPCPFCGEIPEVKKITTFVYMSSWDIGCINYACAIRPSAQKFYDTEQEAIKAWNERTEKG